MAKTKKKYPKSRQPYKNGDGSVKTQNSNIKYNRNVYTDEYKHQKEYQETQKPLILRLLVVAVACVVFLSFVILPLVM